MFVWCGLLVRGSLRTGFPRGPEDAIRTIPSHATPVLLALLLVWRVRRPPRTGRGGAALEKQATAWQAQQQQLSTQVGILTEQYAHITEDYKKLATLLAQV